MIATFTVAMTVGIVQLGPPSGYTQAAQPVVSAEALVDELRQFSASIPGLVRSNGVPDPTEERRAQVYHHLWELGPAVLPTLNNGLADSDVRLRRNVALFLMVAAGGWYDRTRPPLDIRTSLAPLITALADTDDRVRELAAQAVGAIGSDASPAVPGLIELLGSGEEGSRNTACIGLAGIGPSASAALPALREALSDSSPSVKRVARRAIDSIER